MLEREEENVSCYADVVTLDDGEDNRWHTKCQKDATFRTLKDFNSLHKLSPEGEPSLLSFPSDQLQFVFVFPVHFFTSGELSLSYPRSAQPKLTHYMYIIVFVVGLWHVPLLGLQLGRAHGKLNCTCDNDQNDHPSLHVV